MDGKLNTWNLNQSCGSWRNEWKNRINIKGRSGHHSQANKASGSLFLLEAHRRLHPKQVGDGVEVVCLAVLLSHLLLYELVPVVVGEAPAGQTGDKIVIKSLYFCASLCIRNSFHKCIHSPLSWPQCIHLSTLTYPYSVKLPNVRVNWYVSSFFHPFHW